MTFGTTLVFNIPSVSKLCILKLKKGENKLTLLTEGSKYVKAGVWKLILSLLL